MTDPDNIVYFPVYRRPSPMRRLIIMLVRLIFSIGIFTIFSWSLEPLNGFFAVFGNGSRSFLPTLCAWTGLEVASFTAAKLGLFLLLLLMLVPNLLPLVGIARDWAAQAVERAGEFGPPKRPYYFVWLPLILLTAALMLWLPEYLGNLTKTGGWLYYAGIGAQFVSFYTLLAFMLAEAYLGFIHYRLWQHSPYRQAKIASHRPARQTTAVPAPTPKPAPHMASNPNHPFYTALAAELIQQTGREGRLPDPIKLAESLRQIHQIMHFSSGPDGRPLNFGEEAVLAIQRLANGQLPAIANLEVAKAMYRAPRPGIVDELAGQLQYLARTESK